MTGRAADGAAREPRPAPVGACGAAAAGAVRERQRRGSAAPCRGQLLFAFPQLKCGRLFISVLKFGGNYNKERVTAASCSSRSN